MYISESVFDKKKLIAIIFRYKKKIFKGVNFLTSKSLALQIGTMNHPKNHKIIPHYH